MPRCPTHCPSRNNGPLLPAAILAGAVALIARPVLMHILIVLAITLSIVFGLGASALAMVIVVRLHGSARRPLAPGRKLRAHAEVLSSFPAIDADQRQITARSAAAPARRPACESGHHPAPAIEQRPYLHAHGSRDEQRARAMRQPPEHTSGARQALRLRRDRGGHHHA
jgi:hypothetical protein